MAAMLQAASLRALPRVRHAFFTREGGVSEGIYSALNGGLGSKDDPERVLENRRRMAEHMGDRKSTRLNSSHSGESRMPSSA